MFDHSGSLFGLAIWVLFIIVAARRVFKGVARPPKASRHALTAAPQPVAPQAARRRLAPAPARPVVAQVFPAPAPRAAIAPSMAETLPAEAAAAFPALDLSLGDAPGSKAASVRRRRLRTFGGGPAAGSPGWAANAIVAMEVLGPPVSLRSGATLGAPHVL